MKNQVSKTLLAVRLDQHLGTHLGMRGLNILLFGWTAKDPKLRTNISHRDWLYDYEVMAFSDYAGCNLLKMEP